MCMLKPLSNNMHVNKCYYVASILKYRGFIIHVSILVTHGDGLFTLVTTNIIFPISFLPIYTIILHKYWNSLENKNTKK